MHSGRIANEADHGPFRATSFLAYDEAEAQAEAQAETQAETLSDAPWGFLHDRRADTDSRCVGCAAGDVSEAFSGSRLR